MIETGNVIAQLPDGHARRACMEHFVTDLQTGLAVDHPPLHRRDGQVQATVSLPEPGLFRVAVSGGGTTPVSQLVMAEQPGDDPPDDDD